MDINVLLNILSATVNPAVGNEVLHQAELALAEIEKVPGYLPLLLQIVANREIPLALQHASVLRFKNLLNEHWRHAAVTDTYFSESDQEVVRNNIYETIVSQQSSSIRLQLCESVYYICQRDFPLRWPCLMPQVAAGFQTNDFTRVLSSVSVLYQIFKRYRHKSDEKLGEVNQLVAEIFPVLLQVFQHFSTLDGAENYEMCRMVAKSFRVVNEYNLPPSLAKSATIDAWMSLFTDFMCRPEPAEAASRAPEDRPLHAFWKAKKTVSKLLTRIYQRYKEKAEAQSRSDSKSLTASRATSSPSPSDALWYGQSEYVDDEFKKFATMFTKDQAPRLQSVFFSLLEANAQGHYLSDRVLNSIFQFMDSAVGSTVLFKAMKKKLDFLLFQSVFGCLALKQADIQMWSDDPHEFIRRETDVATEFHDPRISATNLLIDLVRTRTAQSLDRVLNRVGELLASITENQKFSAEMYHFRPMFDLQKNFFCYSQCAASGVLPDSAVIEKDVALRVVGSLSELLVKRPEHVPALEQLLLTHVLPDLAHPSGFLRARACWVVNRFSSFAYTDPTAYTRVVQGVFQCLGDRELPVKMEACTAITAVIRGAKVLEPFRPLIPAILDAFFGVMDEIGNEDVIVIFDSLIEKFGDEISPFAVQLVQRMILIFMSLALSDIEDDDAICTALSCLRAVNTVLHSVHSLPHLYEPLEALVLPAIQLVFQHQAMDFFDDVLESMTCFTYYPKAISDPMWRLFPHVLQAFNEYACDYISSMIHPIDNFIVLGTDRFLADAALLEGVLAICHKILSDDHMEVEGQFAAKMIETILSAARGRIDAYFSAVFRLLLQKLAKTQTLSLKLLLLNAVGAAAFYSGDRFLAECVAIDCTVWLINFWLSHCDEMKGDFQRRVAVLGLGSLCHVPLSQQPPALAARFDAVLGVMLQLLEPVDQADEDEDEHESGNDAHDMGNDDEDEDEDDEHDPRAEFNECDDDQDAVDAADVEYLKSLAEKVKNGFAMGDDGSDVSDSDFESPLDEINHFIAWATAMQAFSQLNPQQYAQWSASLSPEQQAAIQKWSSKAAEEKAAEDKANSS